MQESHEDIIKLIEEVPESKIKSQLLLSIDNWKVYRFPISIKHAKKLGNSNYQIERSPKERIIVRTWHDKNNKLINFRYYYLTSTDKELAGYIVGAFIQKLEKNYRKVPSTSIKELIHG